MEVKGLIPDFNRVRLTGKGLELKTEVTVASGTKKKGADTL